MALPETPPESPEAGVAGAGVTEQSVPPADCGDLRRRIEYRLRLMQAITGLERLWLESWVLRALCLSCLAVMLSGVLPGLPGWLHLGVLVLAAAGLLAAAAAMVRRFRWPDRQTAIRRWEGGHVHRPLTASFDRLSQGGDPLTEALWLEHKRQARAEGAGLAVGLMVPEVAARDPWGLRAIPVLAFVIALTVGWQDPAHRLRDSLTPGPVFPGRGLTAEVWLTPPAYTGLPPLTRSLTLPVATPEAEEALRAWKGLFSALPSGTRVQLLVRSDAAVDVHLGGMALTPDVLDQKARRWDLVLTPDAERTAPEIRISSFWRTWLTWPVHVVADQPPSLAWVAPPVSVARPGADGALTLPLRGDDDWGFTALSLELRREGEEAPPVALPLSGQPKTLRSAVSAALAAHPWAGLEVQVRVRGQDAAGQDGLTDWAAVTLPERSFTHPVARKIIATRKTLMTVAPPDMIMVSAALSHLSAQPGAFGGDPVTFLALRVAALRAAVFSAGTVTPEARQATGALLWQTAVRVEDGRLAGARDALEQARQDLADAVERHASPEEMQAAIAAVRRAAGAFINELLNRMEGMAVPLPQMSGLAMSADSIDRMAQALEDLSRLGSAEAARQMMDQLSRALSRLQSAASMPDARQMERVSRMMEALQEAVRQQEALLKQTFDIRQDEPARRKGTPSRFASRGTELGTEQEQLAQRLKDSVGAAGPDPSLMPESLAAAQSAMTAAADSLRSARWEEALESQAAALSALKKGQGEALGNMMSRGGGGPMVLMSPGGPGLSDDPTGRGGDSLGTAGQPIPDKPQRAKAWDLLQELRRRASDRNRPAEELEYLNRLLKLF